MSSRGALAEIRFLDYRRFIILHSISNCLRNFPFRRIILRDVLGSDFVLTRRTCRNPLSWILLSLGQVSRCALWAIARIVLTYSSFISLRSTHSFAKSASWILLHDSSGSCALASSGLSSPTQSPLRRSLGFASVSLRKIRKKNSNLLILLGI